MFLYRIMHPLHFGSVAFSSPLNFWSYLPDSIGPIQRYRRTSAVSDVSVVGRRTSDAMGKRYLTIWEKYAEMIFDGTKKYEARPLSCRPLKDVQSGEKIHFHYYRTGNFVATLWESTSLTAWLIWFWISALATWSRGRRLWKMSLRLGFNWVTIQRSSYWFKQCIHESTRQCCNTWNFNSHPSKWLCTQDAYLELYARKGLTSMSDMIVLELAHPKLIHKDDDPTEPLPPNRKRKRQTTTQTVIEIQDSAHASWKVGGGSSIVTHWRGSTPVGQPSWDVGRFFVSPESDDAWTSCVCVCVRQLFITTGKKGRRISQDCWVWLALTHLKHTVIASFQRVVHQLRFRKSSGAQNVVWSAGGLLCHFNDLQWHSPLCTLFPPLEGHGLQHKTLHFPSEWRVPPFAVPKCQKRQEE